MTNKSGNFTEEIISMFSFFKKKVLLKDQLNGFIDIHNHILPGIDDGAASVEDSLALIEQFEEIGITRFIATPHIMNDYYPNTPETVNLALTEVRTALKNKGKSNIFIHAAAEYMMDHSFMELLEKERLLTLNGSYVLVEMSYFQAPINLNEILFQLQTQKYTPILAHPERYVYFHSTNLDKYEELKRRGCYFQVNLLSLLGHYGSRIQETAYQLLDNELVDFFGSDTHQLRHLEKLFTLKIPEKRLQQIQPILQRTSETFKHCFSQTTF